MKDSHHLKQKKK